MLDVAISSTLSCSQPLWLLLNIRLFLRKKRVPILKWGITPKEDVGCAKNVDVICVHAVSRKGHSGLARYFLESGGAHLAGAATRQGQTPLHAAAANGHIFVVEMLLRWALTIFPG